MSYPGASSFGGDEETSGIKGAKTLAEYFAKEGIEFEFLLDEGSVVTEGIMPGLSKPLALIGTAEKGYADICLEVSGEAGHAAMPPSENPATILVEAVRRVLTRLFPLRRVSFQSPRERGGPPRL